MLQTDYLVIGCGATAMAFVDTLLAETTDAQILIVDRNPHPGGHWTMAYPFVTLHQPAQYYGVASKELSDGVIYEEGWNKGFYSLSSLDHIQQYYRSLMEDTFLASGRVQYFPECEYKGNFEFESLKTGEKYQVEVRKKMVDATYFKTKVPATHTPNFEIEAGVNFIIVNDLPQVKEQPEKYVIVGGGKTGMDACLWLLEQKVDPEHIIWIVSRDSWLLDRQNTQPSEAFFEYTIGTQAAQMEAIARSNSIEDLFDQLEAVGVIHRIDKNVRPKMFHGAIISKLEMKALREIKHIIRLGRVQRIEKEQMVFSQDTVSASPNYLYVDCSASAISNLDIKPIFQGNLITPQTVRAYQPTFSASFIAYVEANYEDEATKNKLCKVVKLPNAHTDWIPMMEAQMVNQFVWSKHKKLRTWVRNNRLDGMGAMVRAVDRNDEAKMAIINRLRVGMAPALIKLQQFVKELNTSDPQPKGNLQLQVHQDIFFKNRLMETPAADLALDEGEVLVEIEKFGYTANNITYAAAGDMIGYWKFFPPFGDDTKAWGIIPVWGFAKVVESTNEAIPVGDRLFGYFPPAQFLKMKPVGIKAGRFIDGAEHRSKLPAGYNLYRRVLNEPNYNPAHDNFRMVLFPLHLTSFCIWDSLVDHDWYGAKQILILSASSKTSIGLGYALHQDENAPTVIGVTSKRNLATVESLKLYDQAMTYGDIKAIDASIPTVIVDMAGNGNILAALHIHLGDNMKHTINVGLTHWANTRPQPGIIGERSEFFFAPGHIQKRIKEWGAAGFDQKTSQFLMETAAKTGQWLKFQTLNGLEELAEYHPAVCMGEIAADVALVVEM